MNVNAIVVRGFTCMRIHIYIHVRTIADTSYTVLDVYTYTDVYVCMIEGGFCTRRFIFIHIYIHTYMHTYTHLCIYTCIMLKKTLATRW